MESSKIIKLRDIAIELCVSQSFLRLEIKRGNLKAFKLGSNYYVSKEDYYKYVDTMKSKTNAN